MKPDNLTYRPWLLCLAVLAFALSAHAQTGKKATQSIRSGNKLYSGELYEDAEKKYNEALEADPASEVGLFNQGNAYFQQEKYEEALQNFELSAGMMEDPAQKAAAFHNLGNAYFKAQDLEKSVEAYKNALRNNPADEDTRYNLALAQSLLQQQQQNQQNQQDQQDQQDEQQQQDQQQQDGEDQQQQDQQQQEDGQEEQNDEQDQQQQEEQGEEQEQQAVQPSQLSKEEVQRILEALANDENKVQEKIIKAKTKTDKVKIEKDW